MPIELTPDETHKIAQLREKYAHTGQDMASYLEGLLHSRYLTYWDYLHIDTLLSLQTPRTEYPDELIFICYHQITELYFKLMLTELDQLCRPTLPARAEVLMRLTRINSYVKHLVSSFDIMVQGMDPRQFLEFRMALLPASGFQSAQFRQIELRLTTPEHLVHPDARAGLTGLIGDAKLLYALQHLYWKFGNLELQTGQKTLTLRMFEEKYDAHFQTLAAQADTASLAACLQRSPALWADAEVRDALRQLDAGLNVAWKLSHYKSAVRYLHKDPEDIRATGGTNWQQYLPPRFQRISFFPALWTEQELAEWGKGWVLEMVNKF